MIWIDMEKPSACRWTDEENNTHSCPFLDREFDCLIQGHIGNWSWDGQYKNCPLHEVTADTDTVSRKQANDALKHDATVLGIMPYDSGYTPFDAILTLHTLPPSPSRPTAEKIQESYYSDNLVCSNCGVEARWDFEYCPYCGFKFKQTEGAV